MKKSILSILLIIPLTAVLLNAQPRRGPSPEQQEKFRSMKIAYYTEALELSSEEAEKFWPVFNEYEAKKNELHKARRTLFREYMNDMESISDGEAEKMIDNYFEFQKKELAQEIEFYDRIREVLPPRKTMKLHLTEMRFREHMLKQLRGGNRPEGGKGQQRGRSTEELP